MTQLQQWGAAPTHALVLHWQNSPKTPFCSEQQSHWKPHYLLKFSFIKKKKKEEKNTTYNQNIVYKRVTYST